MYTNAYVENNESYILLWHYRFSYMLVLKLVVFFKWENVDFNQALANLSKEIYCKTLNFILAYFGI